MTIHIGAAPGDFAETVLMPGDPRRAEWVAKTFFEDVVEVNTVRGMSGFTGTWRGHKVSVQGSGMGMPSLSIYANELIRDFGARTLIRIGSAGAMQPDIELRDVVIAMTASTVSTPSDSVFREMRFAPCANYELLSAAVTAARARNVAAHVGGIFSSDTFYDERDDLTEILQRHGTLAVEMEAAELYTVAARYGCRALAVLTISDHLVHGTDLSAQDRQESFSDMVEIALAAAFPDASTR